MDGPFLDLTAELIEGELDDYWHEMYKVQKLFMTRRKKVPTDRKTLSSSSPNSPRESQVLETGSRLPSRAQSANRPSNSATLELINTIQERMKDFKVFLADKLFTQIAVRLLILIHAFRT